MNEKPTTIIIADDHPIMRKGIREIIVSNKSFNIIAEADDGEKALSLIEEHKPQIAIIDVDMPKMNGFDVAQKIQQRGLSVSVVMLTMYETESMFNRALDYGVMGYVVKASAEQEIVKCLHEIAEGKHFISPSLTDFLMKRKVKSSSPTTTHTGLSSLTKSEHTVLTLIAERKTTNEIAHQLSVSPRTIETHRRNICDKLGISGTNALLAYAIENKQSI
ncbi:MAG: response regulator transcription factor [Ignavibacteriales bacterium]|nr:response regulator transcription factor [Ignavibacteriales bacterium]